MCSFNRRFPHNARFLTASDQRVEAVRGNGAPRNSEGGSASASLLGAISAHTCRRITVRLLIVLLVALVVPRGTHAQVLYGSLTGNITDQKGAAIPGAKVE